MQLTPNTLLYHKSQNTISVNAEYANRQSNKLCSIVSFTKNLFTTKTPCASQEMSNSIAEHLNSDMQCEGLLECFHGLTELDKDVYRGLVESSEPLTVDEIAEAVDRERSTAYRSVQRLLQAGFIQKEQINYDQGGYYHVYLPTDPSQITDDMRRMLNDWYAMMGQLIQEFEDKYSQQIPHQTSTEA